MRGGVRNRFASPGFANSRSKKSCCAFSFPSLKPFPLLICVAQFDCVYGPKVFVNHNRIAAGKRGRVNCRTQS